MPAFLGGYVVKKGTRDDWALVTQFLQELRREGGDLTDPNSLQHMRFVTQIAFKLKRQAELAQLSVMDLVQEGYLGLLRARVKFEPARGLRFSTYARHWILAMMLNAILDSSSIYGLRVSRKKLEHLRNLEKSTGDLINRRIRPPTAMELFAEAHRMHDFSLNLVRELMVLAGNKAARLQDRLPGDNGDDMTLESRIADPSLSAEYELIALQQRVQLHRCLNRLEERQRQVLILKYGLEGEKPKSLAAIGREVGLSRERIRQISLMAHRNLKKQLASTLISATETDEHGDGSD